MVEVVLFGLNQAKSLDGIISQNEYCEFPGLNYLSEYLIREGIQNKVYENVSLETVPLLINSNHPQLVGFSIFGTNYTTSIEAAGIVKHLSPRTLTVFGGPLASSYPSPSKNIDVTVVGEGEKTLLEIFQRISDGRCLEDIQGVIYFSNGKLKNSGLRERLTQEELDSVNVQNLHRTFSPQYRKHIPHSVPFNQMRYGLIVGSRGCVNSCDFCDNESLWHRKVSIRSPENVIDETDFLSQRSVNYIGFMDTDFLMNNLIYPGWTARVAQGIIDREIKTKYNVMASVKTAAKFTLFDLLRKSGCVEISLGMESTNPKVISSIGKHFSLDELRTAVDKIYSAGIYPSLYVLFGHPDESTEGLDEQYEFLRNLKWCRLRPGFVIPYPGTPLYRRVEEEELWLDGYRNRFELMNGDNPVIRTSVDPERLVSERKRVLQLYFSEEYGQRFRKIAGTDNESLRANNDFKDWLKSMVC